MHIEEVDDFFVSYKQSSSKLICASILKSKLHSCLLCVQKAMKEKNIDIAQVEKDVLGTANENQPPPTKSTTS